MPALGYELLGRNLPNLRFMSMGNHIVNVVDENAGNAEIEIVSRTMPGLVELRCHSVQHRLM